MLSSGQNTTHLNQTINVKIIRFFKGEVPLAVQSYQLGGFKIILSGISVDKFLVPVIRISLSVLIDELLVLNKHDRWALQWN